MKTYNQFTQSELMVAGVGEMVRTIEKIAASRLHQLNIEVKRLQAYAAELERVLNYLSTVRDVSGLPLLAKHDTGKSVLVIVGGNKGLVGGLNNRLMNLFIDHRSEYTHIVAVGRRVNQLLEEEHITADKYFEGYDDDIDQTKLIDITEYLFTSYPTSGWKKVDLLYAKYVSLSSQEPVIEPYLPFTFALPHPKEDSDSITPLESALPIYEPSRERVFEKFLDFYIRVRFYQVYIEAKLSELSARTIEMEHAAVKADEMLVKIRHDYIKQRRMNATLKQLSSFAVSRMI